MNTLMDLINRLVEVDSKITFESTKGQFDKTKQLERNEIRNEIEVIAGRHDRLIEALKFIVVGETPFGKKDYERFKELVAECEGK